MKKRIVTLLMIGVMMLTAVTGCGSKEEAQSKDGTVTESAPQTQTQQGAGTAQTSLAERVAEYSYAEIFSDRDMEQVADTSEATYITLADGASKVDGKGAAVQGDVIGITKEGVYVIGGSLSDGQIVIECEDDAKVQLVLDDVSITNDTGAAIYVKEADKVFVTTVAGTNNTLSVTGTMEADGDNNVDGVIFSKSDLTINGEGALVITNETDHAIVGKDDVVVTGSDITIRAKGDGIQANDLAAVAGGTIVMETCEEGMESTVIAIHGGDITICATDDGLNATDMNNKSSDEEENGGFFGGRGGENMFSSDGVSLICIFDGVVKVTANGDGIDSNGEFYVGGGELYVAGPENGGNGALDYAGTGQIDGGVCVATGMSQMAMNFGSGSAQASVMVTLGQTVSDTVVVKKADGTVLMQFTPGRSYNSVVISCSDMAVGDTLTVEAGSISKQVEVTANASGGNGGFGDFGGRGGDMGGHRGGKGNNGNSQEGEVPTMPEGEMPFMPDGMEAPTGEIPAMPEGEMPSMPDGEMPQMPEGMDPSMGGAPGRPGEATGQTN